MKPVMTSNINKVKYFLHGRKSSVQQTHPSSIPKKKKVIDENYGRASFKLFDGMKREKKQKSIIQQRKQLSAIQKLPVRTEESTRLKSEQCNIKTLQKQGMYSMFTNEQQRQDFFQFLQGLKSDAAYQNTITMFTVMYYYQKKQQEAQEAEQ